MILGYFEEIPGDKRLKFTANAVFMVILYMIILNCIFVLWVGLYGRWKKFTSHPPNYVQSCHFQRRENMNFILNIQSAFIYH